MWRIRLSVSRPRGPPLVRPAAAGRTAVPLAHRQHTSVGIACMPSAVHSVCHLSTAVPAVPVPASGPPAAAPSAAELAAAALAQLTPQDQKQRQSLIASCNRGHHWARFNATKQLVEKFGATLGSSEYALLLRTWCTVDGMERFCTSKWVIINWKKALNMGFLREHLRSSWVVLDMASRRGDHQDVKGALGFLLLKAQADAARAIQEDERRTAGDATIGASSSLDDLRTVERVLSEPITVRHQDQPALHLDRRIYHTALESLARLGAVDRALRIVTVDMPQSVKLLRILPHSPTWSPGRAEVGSARAPRPIRPEDAAPSTLTFLMLARIAFDAGRYELVCDMSLRALHEAERDWSAKQKTVRSYLAESPQATVDDDIPLAALPASLYKDVSFLQQGFVQYAGASNQMVPPIGRELALEELPMSDKFTSAAQLTSAFATPDDLPSFTHWTPEDMWRLQWSLLAVKDPKRPNSRRNGASSPTAGTNDELAHLTESHRSIVTSLLSYARNPLWLQAWFVGQPPLSLHDSSLLNTPSPAPSPSNKAGPPTGDAITLLLLQNSSATLELMLRLLAKHGAHGTIANLYIDAILPTYEVANQSIVRRLLADGEVLSIDAPPSSLPSRLTIAHRLRTPHDPDGIFNVTTLPPNLGPALPPLSPLVQDLVLQSLINLADTDSRYSSHLVRVLESRAYVNTVYRDPQPTGTIFDLYRSGALHASHVREAIDSLPNNAWQLAKQITDRIFKGILLPYSERAERDASDDHAGVESESAATSSRTFHITSSATRAEAQSIFAGLMRRYFTARKYTSLISVYEQDHLSRLSPPLALSVSQSLYVLQAYTWVGNISSSLDILDEFLPLYSNSQKVSVLAFTTHFLETHIVKSIRQRDHEAWKQQQKQEQQRIEAGIISQHFSSATPTMVAEPIGVPPSSSSSPSSFSSLPSLSSSLPSPSMMPTPSVSSLGSPILSRSNGPAYHSHAGYVTIDAPSLASRPTKSKVRDEADWEKLKVESWKRELAARNRDRSSAAKPVVEHLQSHEALTVTSALFDDEEFMQQAWRPLVGGVDVSSSSRAAFGLLAHSAAPQSGAFSFGMGSPAFSSYATSTAQIVEAANANATEIDPIIQYQLSQIRGLLDQFLEDPSLLHFDPVARVCDLRSCVSYNQGRCILYLLSLWIKSNAVPSTEYHFLLPRSILRHDRAEDVWSLSDLEHLVLHSYSAEYLLTQYFPQRMQVRAVDPNERRTVDQRTEERDTTEEKRTFAATGADAFGRPIQDQAYAIFTITM